MTDPSSEPRTGGDVVCRRVLAYVVDAVALGGAILLGVGRLERSRGSRLALGVLVGSVGGLLYHVLLEGRWGQTLGKRLLGIVVVREDGEPCTYAAATIRTGLRLVDALPVAYLVGLVAIALTERHQRLGDLLAGTVVVRTDEERP